MKKSTLTAFTVLFYSATLIMNNECLASASLNRVAPGSILQMQTNWQKEIQENPSIKKLIEDQEGLLRTLPKRGESSTPVSDAEIAYIQSLKLECLAPERLKRLQPHQGGSKLTAEQAANLREVVKKSIETKWNGLNEKYPLSPTQVHLKIALGNKYIDGNSLAALKQNLETFIKKAWPPSMWDQKAIEKLAELFVFELEEYKKGNLVMYHGLGGAFLSFYQYTASLHALLKGEHMDDFEGLRGNHIPFINKNTKEPYKNIFEMYDVLGCEDYKNGNDTRMLFVNPTMISDKPSSLGFFFTSRSFNISSAKSFMLKMLVSLGMPIELAQQCYNEWYSLYAHFYQSAGGSKPNGGMLAVSIPADLSRTHTLLADANGNPYAPYESEIPEIDNKYITPLVIQRILKQHEEDKSITPSIIQMIHNLQEEAGKKPEERRDLQNLTSEARIYLDPMKKFEVRGVWHYDLDEKQKQEFEQCWNTMIKAHVSRLLKAKKLPVEYSLIGLDSNDSLITKAQKALGNFS
ncbi:hypothetical protein FACS1894122_09630 [Alphaproteobacteria bacterium]|nr:hypothetical protein FACS1894122_09630 [Alphaproteobacteria bacterium]